eukprot:scaffold35146_cov96-Isochrysis_galbana.AAC.2
MSTSRRSGVKEAARGGQSCSKRARAEAATSASPSAAASDPKIADKPPLLPLPPPPPPPTELLVLPLGADSFTGANV